MTKFNELSAEWDAMTEREQDAAVARVIGWFERVEFKHERVQIHPASRPDALIYYTEVCESGTYKPASLVSTGGSAAMEFQYRAGERPILHDEVYMSSDAVRHAYDKWGEKFVEVVSESLLEQAKNKITPHYTTDLNAAFEAQAVAIEKIGHDEYAYFLVRLADGNTFHNRVVDMSERERTYYTTDGNYYDDYIELLVTSSVTATAAQRAKAAWITCKLSEG